MADPLQLAQAAKSYTDLQNVQNLTNAQSQLLNTQGLSGKNIYATQVLSGAIPGGQSAYDAAKQSLQQQGIDVSNWAPDVATGAQQAVAAKLSQSPLGPLIDAQIKQQQANAATAGVNGTMAPGPQPIGGGPLGALLSGAANSVAPGAGALMQQSAPTQAWQTLPPVAPLDAAAVTSQANALPQVSFNNTPANAPAAPPSGTGIGTPSFVPPNTTGLNPKTANEVIQRAFDQYKANPNYIAASKEAEATGTAQGNLGIKANSSSNTLAQINQNLNALQSLVPQIPTSNYLSPDAKAEIYNRLPSYLGSDKDAASAEQNFQQINQQQIINGLKQFAADNPGSRLNQTIDKIVSKGYAVNIDQPTQGIMADIATLRNELGNSDAVAQNMAGKPTAYNAIPVYQPQSAPPAAISQLPMPAVQLLKQNPALADQFDAKYGRGASKMVLGQ